MLAVVGFCGPAIVFVGLCLLSWAVVGLRGPALACVGTPVGRINRIRKQNYKKKTYQGLETCRVSSPPAAALLRWLSWASWACIGLRWPSLAGVAVVGLGLAIVGLGWLSSAGVGCHWPGLAVVGHRGPALACVGLLMVVVVVYTIDQ